MAYTIVTNNKPRPIVDACELTPAERERFDYLDWPAITAGEDSASFVRYKGDLFDLGEVLMAPDDLKALGWDGYVTGTYFSGWCFRYFDRDGYELDGGDSVIVGLYMVTDDHTNSADVQSVNTMEGQAR